MPLIGMLGNAMNKMEKAAGGVNRTVETATIEVKANHMARELITLYPIP